MRREVWLFQMSVEKRSIAQKQARPFGLRGKWRQAALQGLARERPLPAPYALPGAICRSNAVRRETATDPKHPAQKFAFQRASQPAEVSL